MAFQTWRTPPWLLSEVGIGVSQRPPTIPSPPNELLILVSLLILISFVLDAYETVLDKVRVLVPSRDCPCKVDACGFGQHRPRRTDRDEGAVGRAQEAGGRSTVRVTIVSRDVLCLIDACGVRVRCTGRIERGEGAIGSAQEAMIHVLRVSVVS